MVVTRPFNYMDWNREVDTEIGQTTHPWVRRVELVVYLIDDDGVEVGPIDRVTAFVGRY